ncbi:MAG TPA: sporulation integral membrane protein YlbJ, partial [Tepidimicrobium sp.]|nr:sporulation integral membrane protein YlbJ [Tepidimicrobium sp.]
MKNSFLNILFLIFILCILLAIIMHPNKTLKSASKGLNTWFNIVVPSLLPFFIISNILIEIGFVKLIGQLLEPLIRFLFNVSGAGAFSFSISAVSGYPVGAKIVSDMRQSGIISQSEANKMICFSSTSGPLFMVGTVATGMLGNPSLIPLIIYPHYLGAITLGVLMRFYKKSNTILKLKLGNTLPNEKTNHSIGSLLTEAVQKSLGTITLIGGFIIFYSVLVELLFIYIPFNNIIKVLCASNLTTINIDILKGFVAGLFEITTGCNIISNADVNILNKIMLINFLVAWSGFSIHSQAMSFINRTDIDAKLYVL